MNRRIALKLIGALGICAVGTWSKAELVLDCVEGTRTDCSDSAVVTLESTSNIELGEDGINDFIIRRKSGKVITIPFSEICDALESN